eukprot:COSAG01_NODE_13420_length_1588_cov_1.427132_2_plen_221_part_00
MLRRRLCAAALGCAASQAMTLLLLSSCCFVVIISDVSGVAAGSVASSAAEVPVSSQPLPVHFDVLVYGATSGGVTAAVAASRHRGVRVGMLVANGGGCGPSDAGANHIGGMSSSGLGKTDIGAAAKGGLIGGLALEFYRSNAAHYNTTAPPSWDHEPHVAQVYIHVLRSTHVSAVVSPSSSSRVCNNNACSSPASHACSAPILDCRRPSAGCWRIRRLQY